MKKVHFAFLPLASVKVGIGYFFIPALLFLLLIGFIEYRLHRRHQTIRSLRLRRSEGNPILRPLPGNFWESEAVFNPAAWYDGEHVHMLYRALGPEGISRLGYAKSSDGTHFERAPSPAYDGNHVARNHHRYTSPARLQYDRVHWGSGGGWGGSEDPRMVSIDGRVHVTFNIFNGWYSMRVGLLSIDEKDFRAGRWNWTFNYLSPPGRHKNWVLFPEKVSGKYALLHNLFHEDESRVRVEFVDEIEVPDHLPHFESPDPQQVPSRISGWHHRTRSASSPPIKTPRGWLVFYHAMGTYDPQRYKVGAMLLDLNDPSRVLYRSLVPVLEPTEWYENDWKPGIVYASGAVVVGEDLIVYYGGGDKHIASARIPFAKFMKALSSPINAVSGAKKY